MAPVPHPIRRLLVANRGEIARRVITGAHDAGCEAVAVYAADDAGSPYVGEADAAVLLPGATLAETYLDPDALVRAAQASGADALHPGLRVPLREPRPARGLRRGPASCGSARRPRRCGSWATRRGPRRSSPTPACRCCPSAVVGAGSDAREQLDAAAGGVGYPLLVKASAGGGGRGHATRARTRRAGRGRGGGPARGGGRLRLGRGLLGALPRPRRATSRSRSSGTPTAACCTSSTGSARCSAGTRRSSRRRRPSSCPARPRHQMWEAAVAAARAVGYVGVGTVEYLVDAERLLLLGDEHPPAGRARRDRAGHRARPRRAAAGGGRGAPASLRPGRRARRRATPSRSGCVPSGPARATGRRPGTVGARALARGARPARRPRHRVGQRRQPRLRLAGGQAHGARRGPGRRRRAAVAGAARARARRPGDQPRRCSGRCSTTHAFRRRRGGHPLSSSSRPDLRDAAAARRRCAAGTPRRWPSACSTERAGREPGPGARGGLAQRRAPAARRPADGRRRDHGGARRAAGRARRRCSSTATWHDVGTATRRRQATAWSTSWPRTGCGGATGCAISAHRADVNGPEGQSSFALRTEDDPDERGGVAGECRAPLPGADHQGPGRGGRHRGRGRRAGRARGDEDGAHPAGQRRRHGGRRCTARPGSRST